MKKEWSGRVELSADLYESGLSARAQRSAQSRGRERPDEPCSLRTPYQRDRDRIVHCKSFRRLKHKTQVFISPEGDHYRTRLTHTLEVSGIARTAARALQLNEDLAEAIALGHDLGHTPFGHAGESVLDEWLRGLGLGGFQHNQQSARVVEVLENDGQGLNLTWEVVDGIRHHSGDEAHPATLEAQIVHLADRIAYVNHDIDDALRAGLITMADLPPGPVALLGQTGSERIDRLVHDLVDASAEAFELAARGRQRRRAASAGGPSAPGGAAPTTAAAVAPPADPAAAARRPRHSADTGSRAGHGRAARVPVRRGLQARPGAVGGREDKAVAHRAAGVLS